MSERAHDESSHARALHLSGALGVVGTSAAGYMLWHHYHTQDREAPVFLDSSETIFEEPRLSEAERRLMAHLAIGIYCATTAKLEGVITQRDLVGLFHARRHDAQHVLGYLLPRSTEERDRREAYIARRRAIGTGRQGYYARTRLIELLGDGGSPTLDDNVFEILHEHPHHDIFETLRHIPRIGRQLSAESA